MSLFGRRSRSEDIAPGDIFRKVGTFRGDWVVERVFDYPDIPRHIRLVERNSTRSMTLAAAILLDPECFDLVEKNAA